MCMYVCVYMYLHVCMCLYPCDVCVRERESVYVYVCTCPSKLGSCFLGVHVQMYVHLFVDSGCLSTVEGGTIVFYKR
jgi:hypothetical protein